MSAFQEMLRRDRDIFTNPDEFGGEHEVEGRVITCTLVGDDHVELSGGNKLGVARASLTLHAKVEDLPPRRKEGQALTVDGREYTIDSWLDNMGMAEVTLHAVHGF